MAPDPFQDIAEIYDKSAAVAEEAGRRLLERLDGLRFEPKTIIEIGSATGRQLTALRQRYPKANLVGIDHSFAMLKQATRRKRWWRPQFRVLQAAAGSLPFAEASADLVYSNLTPSWLDDPARLFSDARRVLRSGGLLLISAFGPDTLRESYESDSLLTRWMTDVQGLGRELVRAGFSEPVLDTDWVTTTHSGRAALNAELQGSGLLAASPEGKNGDGQESQPVAVQWEIVSASAWAPEAGQPVRSLQGEEVSIPLSQIGRRQRS